MMIFLPGGWRGGADIVCFCLISGIRGFDLCVVRGESVFPHGKSKPVNQRKPAQGTGQALMCTMSRQPRVALIWGHGVLVVTLSLSVCLHRTLGLSFPSSLGCLLLLFV